jgi:hypothetical protein
LPGGLIGYKFAIVLTVLLALSILVGGVLLFIGYQEVKKAQQNAVFDAKSLSTTLLWLEAEGGKVTEVDAKKNEVMSKEAMEKLSRTLAGAEAKQVQWQVTVGSVTPAAVTVQSPSLGSGYPLTFGLVAARSSSDAAEQPDGLVLPITAEQSRKLIAGQPITITGRVRTCYAKRSGANLAFTLVVSEARVVD